MTVTVIPPRPSNEISYFALNQEKRRKKTPWYVFGDPDFRWGRKDGRISPSAWRDSLGKIRDVELETKAEIRNAVAQGLRDASETLQRFPELREQNRQKREDLAADGGLMPEAVAATQLKTANFERAFAIFLLACEIGSLALVAKSTFGNGILGALVVAILLSSVIVSGTRMLLAKISPERRGRLRMGMLVTGCLLGATGLIGFVILRSQTFAISLTGGNMDMGQLSIGNILLMAGITLGVPLVVGVLYDEAVEKRNMALNSLTLYRDRNLIDTRDAEWKVAFGKLEEYDRHLDELTERAIGSRQGSYRRGFHRSAASNPEAAQHVKELVATTA
jgi:hypothetical protein